MLRCWFVMVAVAFCATGAFAQHEGAAQDPHAGMGAGHGQGHGQGQSSGIPSVDEHLKVLTRDLNLTSPQQTKVRRILQQQRDETQKLMQDQNMSREDRMEKSRASRDQAHKQIRDLLNDEQKKKLDAIEQQERDRMRQGHDSMPPGHPAN